MPQSTASARADWSRKINRFADDCGYPNADTGEQELPAYAWPGGYPVVYVDGIDESVCPACANKRDEGGIVDYFIHYEGPPEQCVACNVEIPSAYGDPDEDNEH